MDAVTVPGHLDAQNKGALDWREGLVAYGCQLLVCIAQASPPPQLLQVLSGHRHRVAHVRWAAREPRSTPVADAAPAPLLLASADASGVVMLWDVLRGVALQQASPALTSSHSPARSTRRSNWVASRESITHTSAYLTPPPTSLTHLTPLAPLPLAHPSLPLPPPQLTSPSGSGPKPSLVLTLHWLPSRPGHLLCAYTSGALTLWHVAHAGRTASALWQVSSYTTRLLDYLTPTLAYDYTSVATEAQRGPGGGRGCAASMRRLE